MLSLWYDALVVAQGHHCGSDGCGGGQLEHQWTCSSRSQSSSQWSRCLASPTGPADGGTGQLWAILDGPPRTETNCLARRQALTQQLHEVEPQWRIIPSGPIVLYCNRRYVHGVCEAPVCSTLPADFCRKVEDIPDRYCVINYNTVTCHIKLGGGGVYPEGSFWSPVFAHHTVRLKNLSMQLFSQLLIMQANFFHLFPIKLENVFSFWYISSWYFKFSQYLWSDSRQWATKYIILYHED